MKIENLKIIDNNLLLGVFGTATFQYLQENRGMHSYSYWNARFMDIFGVINIVSMAAKEAQMIVFVLDDVHFPIDPSRSITCAELELICTYDHLFEKTTFVKGDNIIDFDRNLVI